MTEKVVEESRLVGPRSEKGSRDHRKKEPREAVVTSYRKVRVKTEYSVRVVEAGTGPAM